MIAGYRPLLLDLTLPDSSRPASVVVCIHGGGWITGSHKATHDDYVGYPALWNTLLENGIAVASVKAAVRWLRRFATELRLDPQRIGVWGESAGGHLAALLAMNTTRPDLEGTVGVTDIDSRIQAAVAWYPPTDLVTLQVQMHPRSTIRHDTAGSPETLLLGIESEVDPERAAWASPITYVSAAASPLMLIHGDEDLVIPHRQSADLHRRIIETGGQSTLVTAVGAGHCLDGVDPQAYIEATAREFRSRLQAGAACAVAEAR